MKKAILVTSFGTSHKDTRKKCLDSIQREVEEKYGNENVERAYTSGIIRRIIEKNEGIHIFDQKEGLKVLKDKGFEEIITMSLHILDGIEYSKLDDKFGKISKPLLADDEDFKNKQDGLTVFYNDNNNPLLPSFTIVLLPITHGGVGKRHSCRSLTPCYECYNRLLLEKSHTVKDEIKLIVQRAYLSKDHTIISI